MTRRFLIVATWISAGLWGFAVVLFVASIWLNPWEHRLSFRDDFHVSVLKWGLDARIVFFNHADYGPYRGSIIGLVDGDGNVYPPLMDKRHFDAPGVYYRYFRWSDRALWTLMVSLWYPLLAFAILPIRAVRRRLRDEQTERANSQADSQGDHK